MIDEIKSHIADVDKFTADQIEAVEEFRIKYLGKKGILNDFFAKFKDIPKEDKKEFGQMVNSLKNKAQEKVNALKTAIEEAREEKGVYRDLARLGQAIEIRARHLVSIVKNQIIEIFRNIGFNVAAGPEVEADWHNFTARNRPEYHPARDMQDTFFIQTDPETLLLRTHTSGVQIRHMEEHQPPFRTISPGRVYRNEDISARSHCLFHQVEGLYVDKGVSFADLKQTLLYFTEELFGKSKIRL